MLAAPVYMRYETVQELWGSLLKDREPQIELHNGYLQPDETNEIDLNVLKGLLRNTTIG